MRPSRVDLSGFEPTVIRTCPEEAFRPTALEAGPFGDEITANLLWFPIDGDLRLTWETVITLPAYESQYHTIVDAETGEILYCKQLVNYVAGIGNVYVRDGDGARQMLDFPRPLGDYGLPIPFGLPLGFPDDWVDVDRTVGNNTNAHQADTGPSFQGQVQYNGVVNFNPPTPRVLTSRCSTSSTTTASCTTSSTYLALERETATSRQTTSDEVGWGRPSRRTCSPRIRAWYGEHVHSG
jgi:hypothetical protein